MGESGTPRGRLQRALDAGNVIAALAAAYELERLTLPDALALSALLAEREPERYDRAAVRWHARYALEVPRVGLEEAQLVLACLAGLRGPAAHASAAALIDLARARRLNGFEQALRRVSGEGSSR